MCLCFYLIYLTELITWTWDECVKKDSAELGLYWEWALDQSPLVEGSHMQKPSNPCMENGSLNGDYDDQIRSCI